MGRITPKKLGSSRPVSSRKTQIDNPRSSTSSMNRSDWVSQTSAASPTVTAISDSPSWRMM